LDKLVGKSNKTSEEHFLNEEYLMKAALNWQNMLLLSQGCNFFSSLALTVLIVCRKLRLLNMCSEVVQLWEVSQRQG